MKKSSRRLLLVVMALVITLAVGTTSTYAWFTLTDIARVEDILLKVNVETGVEIAGGHPGKTGWTSRWYSTLSNYELLLANNYLTDLDTSGAVDAADATAFLNGISLVDLSPQLYSTTLNQGITGSTAATITNSAYSGNFGLLNADGTSADYAYVAAGYRKLYLTAWQSGIYAYTAQDALDYTLDTDVLTVAEAALRTPVIDPDPLTLTAGIYWVPFTAQGTALPAIDKGYLAFDITLRTAKTAAGLTAAGLTNGYIPVRMNVPTTGTVDASANTSNDIKNTFDLDGITADEYGTHDAIAYNAAISANAANAARFAFIPYNSSTAVTTSTLPVFSFSTNALVATDFYGTGDNATARIYDPRYNQGYHINTFGTGNLARKYYFHFNNLASSMTELNDFALNTNYYNADQVESVVLNSSTIGQTEIGRLYPTGGTAGNGKTYYQGSIRVYIWIEGKDGDCFNSIIGQMFNSQLAFTIPTIID